jgi:hypothetical protein
VGSGGEGAEGVAREKGRGKEGVCVSIPICQYFWRVEV